MSLEIRQFSYMSDNYGALIHAPDGATALVDAGDASAALAALKKSGWTLSHILVTHHHGDHTAGLAEVKAATGATVVGPAGGKTPVDMGVGDGDEFDFGGRKVCAIHTPGHTLDMINYHFPEDGVAFTGDTLFTLGCGRVFEGDMDMMWRSLSKLAALPPETIIYSAHEYTLANARFAVTVDPDNDALQARADKVAEMREAGEATSPTTLAEELATNPFLRAGDADIRRHLGMEDASDAEVFGEIRRRKDGF